MLRVVVKHPRHIGSRDYASLARRMTKGVHAPDDEYANAWGVLGVDAANSHVVGQTLEQMGD